MIVAACLATAFFHNAATTWERWGDVIVDSGRELDVPRQMLAGRALYADIRYWYGPLAPWVNRALYGMFGVEVGVLTAAGLVSAMLLAWLAYRTLRLFTGRPSATTGAVVMLYVNAFAQLYPLNIFNFVLPYAFPATYGMVLALASLYFLIRDLRTRRRHDLWLSCACLGLTALCKPEVLAAALVAHALAAMAASPAQRSGGRLAPYAAAIALPALAYGWLWLHGGANPWPDLRAVAAATADAAYSLRHGGLDDPWRALTDAATSAAGLGAMLLLSVAGSIAADRLEPSRPRSPRLPGLVAGLCSGALVLALGPFRVLRALPILLLAVFAHHLMRALRDPSRRPAEAPALVLYGCGLAALVRVAFRCGAEHYGFFLLVPGLLGFVVFWTEVVPARLSPRSAAGSAAGRAHALVLLAALAWSHAQTTQARARQVYGSEGPVRIRTAQGSLACSSRYVGTVDEAVRYLATTPPSSTVVALPEGAALAFLAGRTNAVGLHTFLPLDFVGRYGEEAVVAALERAAPDYVVITARDVREYGRQGFGIDYGRKVAAWVEARYAPLRDFRSPLYRVVVLGRRAAASAQRAQEVAVVVAPQPAGGQRRAVQGVVERGHGEQRLVPGQEGPHARELQLARGRRGGGREGQPAIASKGLGHGPQLQEAVGQVQGQETVRIAQVAQVHLEGLARQQVDGDGVAVEGVDGQQVEVPR